MEDLRALLDYVIIPLIIWIWHTDRKVVVLQTKIDDVEKIDKKMDLLFDKIDSLKDDLHGRTENFVSKTHCDNNCSK